MVDPQSPGQPLSAGLIAEIEHTTSRHLGQPWTCRRLTDLADRSSHPAALLHGDRLSIFAKVLNPPDAAAQARAELSGLTEIRRLAGVSTPQPVGTGQLHSADLVVLLLEALVERPPAERDRDDWRSIGHVLADLHTVIGGAYGWPHNAYFGPLHLDNRPVSSPTWADFYAERRLLPWLRSATDARQLPPELAHGVEQVVARLPTLVGPDPPPSLVHGDAQHHNFVSTADGAVVIDAAPYYGHPEIDLALVDYFVPVPPALFSAYRERHPIDPGFADRRELWRLFAYLGLLTAGGDSTWGRSFLDRLASAVKRYG